MKPRAELETRASHGLEQFCAMLDDRPGLNILDLASATQSTISFVTDQGHRLYSDDFLLQLDECFGTGDFYENQADSNQVEKFVSATLDFPVANFDGALVWDVLEYLTPRLLARVVTKLHAMMRPGACLLAVFHAEERKEPVPSFAYRIQDRRTIVMTPRGARRPAQFFNNRGLEKLFQDFHSVKFFLTRDALREVIVKR
ncbi:MAG TPA: hypothetical protein VH639_03700 [Bryobacteraceae bacterium]